MTINSSNLKEIVDNLNFGSYASSKLLYILNSTSKGSKQVLLTPIGKAVNPDLILKEWNEIFDRNSNYLNSDLIKFEHNSKAKDFTSRSIAKPWIVMKESFEEHFGMGPNISLGTSFDEVSLKGTLRPVSFDKARDLLKNRTNAGAPSLLNKGQVKPSYTKDIWKMELERLYPCIIFTRTQENGKTRYVWGYPMCMTVLENMYYTPLLQFQKKLTWRAALLGPDEVDKRVYELVTSTFRRNVVNLSIDFKKYDASLKPNVQKPGWSYIKSLFQPQHHGDLDKIISYFHTCGIVTPGGIMHGDHGVPSGSVFTNELDSICQHVISRSTQLVFNENKQIQGDDGVYSIDRGNVDSLINAFKVRGLNVHEDEDLVSNVKCEYLRKLYHVDYLQDSKIGGIYSTYRALGRIVFQERWTDFEDFGILGKDFYSIRTICILENCKHHPLFRELVKFVLKLDKYKLKYSQDGLLNYVRMVKDSTGSEGLIRNQYGDDISGIQKFETFKVISELGQ